MNRLGYVTSRFRMGIDMQCKIEVTVGAAWSGDVQAT